MSLHSLTRTGIARGFSLIVLIPFVAIALRLVSPVTADVSYFVLAAYALLGRSQAIQALALSWLFTMVNPGIAPEAALASIGRYAVLLGAAASVLLRSGLLSHALRIRRFTWLTLLLGAFIIIHSLFISPIPDVSILKALSWTIGMATLISAWSGLTSEQAADLERWIFGGLIVVMMISLPLLVHPVGYLRNGLGFQGILNHPQAFGLTVALPGAWVGSRLFVHKPPPWRLLALFIVCLVLVILSQSRTAGIALVLGLGGAIVVAPALAGRSIRSMLPGLRSKRLLWIFLAGAIALIPVLPQLGGLVKDFIGKSGRAGVTTLAEAYDDSRGTLIDRMLENIAAKPFQGIGFGIASHPGSMDIERDPVLGLPISASVEKGVMPLAVLEEVGVIGFVLVALWVGVLLRRSAIRGVAPLAVCTVALLMNLGEATLFSAGGLGLLTLILVSWAVAAPARSTNTEFRP